LSRLSLARCVETDSDRDDREEHALTWRRHRQVDAGRFRRPPRLRRRL